MHNLLIVARMLHKLKKCRDYSYLEHSFLCLTLCKEASKIKELHRDRSRNTIKRMAGGITCVNVPPHGLLSSDEETIDIEAIQFARWICV